LVIELANCIWEIAALVGAAVALFLQKRRKSAGRMETDFLKTPYNDPLMVASRKATPLFPKQGT
jgi:hypothetical protein